MHTMNHESPRDAHGRRAASSPSRYSSLDDLRFDYRVAQREAHVAGWRRNIRALVVVVAALVVIVVLRTFL